MIMLMSNISVIILVVGLILVLSALIMVQYCWVWAPKAMASIGMASIGEDEALKNVRMRGIVVFVSLSVLMIFAVLPRVINYLW